MTTNSTEKTIKLIAVYARVSTANQEKEGTIENQLAEMRKYAEDHSYIIVKEYLDEGWSGMRLDRPALENLRQDAQNKLWEAVLCYDPDRLARRFWYQELVTDELKKVDVRILYVTTPAPKTAEDQMLYSMKGAFAEYERAKISERFRIGKLRSINDGHIMVSAPLYGYTHVPTQRTPGQPKVHGYYTINEEEAVVVRKMFEWVANEDLNIRQIVLRLQELGIKPRKSARGVWSTSTLTTLLRNGAYIGKAHWYSSIAVEPKNPIKKEHRQQIKSSRRPRPPEEWRTVPVPKIVDEALFSKVRERLAVHIERNPRCKKYEYLLANVMECGCGVKRGGAARKRGQYLYYDCYDKVYAFPLPRKCHENPINARIADRLVWERLTELLSSSELLIKHAERAVKALYAGATVSTDATQIERQIAKLKQQEDRYTKAYGAEVITLEQLQENIAPIREKIASLQLEITKTRQQGLQNDYDPTPNGEEINDFAEATQDLLSGDLSFEQKRAIVLRTVEKIVGTQEKLQVSGFIPVTTTNYGGYTTEDRNCGVAERGEVHVV